MTTARLLWMTALSLSGLAFIFVLAQRRVFDPRDKKKALAFLFVGFVGLFAAGWYLFPPPEDLDMVPPPLPADLPLLPPA